MTSLHMDSRILEENSEETNIFDCFNAKTDKFLVRSCSKEHRMPYMQSSALPIMVRLKAFVHLDGTTERNACTYLPTRSKWW